MISLSLCHPSILEFWVLKRRKKSRKKRRDPVYWKRWTRGRRRQADNFPVLNLSHSSRLSLFASLALKSVCNEKWSGSPLLVFCAPRWVALPSLPHRQQLHDPYATHLTSYSSSLCASFNRILFMLNPMMVNNFLTILSTCHLSTFVIYLLLLSIYFLSSFSCW